MDCGTASKKWCGARLLPCRNLATGKHCSRRLGTTRRASNREKIGRTFMEMSRERQTLSDTSALQTTSDELIKLICKLRWIGMEDEAERLLQELARRRGAADESVVATSGDTD
jgi:hypothetical protein